MVIIYVPADSLVRREEAREPPKTADTAVRRYGKRSFFSR